VIVEARRTMLLVHIDAGEWEQSVVPPGTVAVWWSVD
jgi:hypothetical protein